MSVLIARIGHGITAAVGIFALVAQLVLVIQGASVLITDDPPSLPERLRRFVLYFTIQSNLLAAVAAVSLVIKPDRDGAFWRVLRLAAVIGMIITGLVHWFFLRPLLDLEGWSYATDKLLHVVAPILVLACWIAFGPRPRIDLRTGLLALIWPVAWVVLIMVQGAVSGWYPYPFLDVGSRGAGPVAIAIAGVAVAMIVTGLLTAVAERRLPAWLGPDRPRSPRTSPAAGSGPRGSRP
ncbi:Pr6Pr family membrane protein [Microlunatus parietis]|uniref:Small-conductance mechanosensitive channel n=1 Tax=Microlunatus parietis TaxID=682979 RepID=A0A7Y9LD64_9ACTN|nr:Pr6Pr family membrane protein [Microlunatus parietis]NYE75554.1 small-conductance mechanosensitive channel [Microlunatus parietis]